MKSIQEYLKRLLVDPRGALKEFDAVFQAEKEYIRARRAEVSLSSMLSEQGLIGLALSGGGIRSATIKLCDSQRSFQFSQL